MRILFISDFFQPYGQGGADISTLHLVKKLSESNECFVATQRFVKRKWTYEGLKVYPILARFTPGKKTKDKLRIELSSLVKFRNVLGFYSGIKKFCKSKDIDLISVQSDNLALLISLLILNRPLCIDVRDCYFTCPFMLKTDGCDKHHLFCLPNYRSRQKNIIGDFVSILYFRYLALVYLFEKNIIFRPLVLLRRRNIVFVCNSKYVKRMLAKEFENTGIKIRVIYNAVNANGYRKKNAAGEKMVLFASSLEKAKGIWDCIYASGDFEKDAVFEIAGDGPETDAIKEYIREMKIKNIRLLGRLEYQRVVKLYEKAYITVQPSVWPEPFGRFILESFASETPLITTATGGTSEAVRDGETGLIVPAGSPEKLKEAVSKLLRNKRLYISIKKNIALESKRFHPDIIAGQRLAVYKSLLEKSGGSVNGRF